MIFKTYLLRFFSPKVWTWEDLLMPRLLPTNTISQPRPLLCLPLPPPSPYSGFYDLSGKQGPCSSPCIGKIIGMTFLCGSVPGFCQQSFALFSCFNEFLFSWKIFTFEFNPPLLHSYRRNPSIEPWIAKFLHTVCQRFCQHSEPCLYPCFSIFQQTMVKVWWGAGGQVWKGRILSLTKNSHRYGPAQTLYFLTHYTATKNSFTLLEIIIGQEKIHGWSAQKWLATQRNPLFCETPAAS